MVEYLLAILICRADCHWQRLESFPTHESCVVAGKAAKYTQGAIEFRCVMQQARG